MLKKFLAAIMIALPALGFAQAKFGVVNTQPIIEAMPEMKDATAQLETASKKYQDEYNNFTEEYNKKVAEVQELQKDSSTPEPHPPAQSEGHSGPPDPYRGVPSDR